MNLPREDAYCPACPDPETAFRLKDVGMKITSGGDLRDDDAFRVTASRPLWEPLMLEHLRLTPDERHQRLHADCVAFLAERGQSAEENARASLQAGMDSVHQSLTRTPPSDGIPCCDLHNRHCEPPGDLCCHGCAEAAHDTFPIRHADGTTCVMEDR